MVRILFRNHTWTFSRRSSLTCAVNWTGSTLMSTSLFSRKKKPTSKKPCCVFSPFIFLSFLQENHKVNGDVFIENQIPLLKYTSKTQRGNETDRREEQIRSELFFIHVISFGRIRRRRTYPVVGIMLPACAALPWGWQQRTPEKKRYPFQKISRWEVIITRANIDRQFG